jgi:hypothetical protein
VPYFTRQPYAMTHRQAEAIETPDILALAADVLARETSAPMPHPLRVRSPLQPGASGSMLLGFTAERGPVAVRLWTTDLTSPDGVIPAEALTIHPSTLALAPGEAADVKVSFAVPASTRPGIYRGRITSAGADGFTAPIEVVVSP